MSSEARLQYRILREVLIGEAGNVGNGVHSAEEQQDTHAQQFAENHPAPVDLGCN